MYDLEKFVDVVKGKQPNTATYLAGHSLGGLISTKAVLRNQKQYAGLVLSSAALDVKRNLMLKLLDPFSGACVQTNISQYGMFSVDVPCTNQIAVLDSGPHDS